MRALWADGVASFAGEHYRVDGAICQPRPLQTGGLPFWIAGGGERKTLRIAAKYASYTNFDGTLDGFRHKSDVLAQHCLDLGRDFDEITRSSNYNVILGATDADVRAKLDWVREHYAPIVPAKADRTRRQLASGPLVGTPGQVVDTLQALDGLGMSYAICVFLDAAYDSSSIELFEREVIPALAG
jgi:alkanesulfonate monooxygenase SsuD/methylene tetrahydromethanopterin reductase-like flavin-dependent oxidoreductase (luciferase family)